MHILMLRHASTEWNELGRIQGRSDVPLSVGGIAQARALRLPPRYSRAACYSSPLQRCTQTAGYLGATGCRTVEALVEMDWGEWEGATLAQMAQRLGERYRQDTARGLDFRPTGGESPRDVMCRLQQWLSAAFDCRSGRASEIVLIAHKGVMRAALALATGWDMRAKFIQPIDWRCAMEYQLTGSKLELKRLNVPLDGQMVQL